MRFTLLGATALSVIATAPAIAQNAAPAAAQTAASDAAPAEIVVTAQKRTERLQDVPVAVSVISGASIANQGGINIEAAQYLVPALNFRKSGTNLNQFLFLRGIGTANFSIAAEPSVSTVLDGVVLANAGEAFGDLVDVERVEVLRGPQGTLFGKNASAGVLNVISKMPTDKFEGSVEGGFFTKGEWRARGLVNVPFNSMVRGRFTGFYSEYQGNIYNSAPTVNRYVNGFKHYGFRGIIQAIASDTLKFTLIGDYRKSNDDCCAEVIGTTPSNVTASALPLAQGDISRGVSQNLITHTDDESYGVSLNAELDAGNLGTVTSITSHRWWNNTEIRDGDFLPQAYTQANQLHDIGPQKSRTFSQELRLTSPSHQTVEYVVGAYYSQSNNRRIFTRNDIVCTPVVGANTAVLIPCGSANANPSTLPSGTADFGSVFKNFAVFGNATIHIGENLRLIGGLRYTHDELSVDHKRVTTLAGPGIGGNFDAGVYNNGAFNPITGAFIPGASNGIPWTASQTTDNLSGRAGIQYDLSRNNTAYFTYARGYKGPAYNVFYNMSTSSTNPIAAETADSFEVGLKNTLFGGTVVLNLAGFYAKYHNFQANNPDIVNGVVTTRLTNAGEVSTRGFEADMIARLDPTWTVSGGLAITDAHIDHFLAPVGAAASAIIPDGTKLTSAPSFKFSLRSDKRWVTDGFADIGFGFGWAGQTNQLSQLSGDPAVRAATTIPGYGIFDLQMSVIDKNDRWQITGYIKNLFDQTFAAAIQTGGPGGSYRYQIPREADRIFGLTAKLNF